MRLALGMWNYFHNFPALKACQFFVATLPPPDFAIFGRKTARTQPPPWFGLIIELIIGNDI
jgi:hypothetical protein